MRYSHIPHVLFSAYSTTDFVLLNLQKELGDKYNGLNNKIASVPSLDDLNQYLSNFVTWPGLEDALKGVRQDFENLQQVREERVVIEHGMQTEPPVSN